MLNNQRVYGKKKKTCSKPPTRWFRLGVFNMNRLLRDEPVLQLLCAVPKCRRGFSLVRPQLLFATVFGVAAQQLQVVFVIFPVAQMSCVFFFSDVGCYHFIGTHARLTFRVRAHRFFGGGIVFLGGRKGHFSICCSHTQPAEISCHDCG